MMWAALKLLVDHIQPQRKQTNLIVGLYKSVWHTWPCMGPGNNRQPMLKKKEQKICLLQRNILKLLDTLET